MDRSTILCILILLIIIGCFLFVKNDKKNEEFTNAPNLMRQDLPTSPEVEFIEGEPNFHIIDPLDDTEIIREGDIALDPGFGMGEGTIGFGRYGSSFIM
ncbi:MAG TPA: hypothetical protein PKD85_05810 [Saprospiraceae bacterium]|nr:hypothetical protein [Saprospiraceae bacterium]